MGTGEPADVAWALAPGVRWQCPHHCGTERSLQTVGKSADGRVARTPARARELQFYAWHRVRRSRLEPILPLGVEPWLHCNARSTGVRGKLNICIYIYISIPSRYIQYIFISTYIYFFKRKIKRMDQSFLKSMAVYGGGCACLVIRQHSQCPLLRIEVM